MSQGYSKSSSDAIEESLVSTLMSLRSMPDIRYVRDSQKCMNLASKISSKMRGLQTKMGGRLRVGDSVLIIMDRREDPLTPLAIDWSYQALIAEMAEFKDNKVTVKTEEFNLNMVHDEFYRDFRRKNYGDLAKGLNKRMEEFTSRQREGHKLDNFEDMQKALHKMPEHRQQAANLKKHHVIVKEITSQVNSRSLLEVSGLEQEILAKNGMKEQYREGVALMGDAKIRDYDKLRVAAMFAVKYEGSGQVSGMLSAMRENVEDGGDYEGMVRKLLGKCGRHKRVVDKGGSSALGSTAKKFYADIFGVWFFIFGVLG